MASNSDRTGTRVPAKQGVPPWISGSVVISASLSMPGLYPPHDRKRSPGGPGRARRLTKRGCAAAAKARSPRRYWGTSRERRRSHAAETTRIAHGGRPRQKSRLALAPLVRCGNGAIRYAAVPARSPSGVAIASYLRQQLTGRRWWQQISDKYHACHGRDIDGVTSKLLRMIGLRLIFPIASVESQKSETFRDILRHGSGKSRFCRDLGEELFGVVLREAGHGLLVLGPLSLVPCSMAGNPPATQLAPATIHWRSRVCQMASWWGLEVGEMAGQRANSASKGARSTHRAEPLP